MTKFIQVSTATAEQADAEKIATALIEQSLVACVHVSGPVRSCYRWKGRVESTNEWLCVAKTTFSQYERIEQEIRRLHPYELPQILAVPVLAGSAEYLRWIEKQVAKPDG